MIRASIVIIALVFYSGFCIAQSQMSEFVGEVYFGSGFNNGNHADSIDFYINNTVIYTDYRIYSIPSLGLAFGGLKFIKIGRKYCAVNYEDEVFYLGKVKKFIEFTIYKNDKRLGALIDFSLGKYVVLNLRKGKLQVDQLERRPEFE